jgi:S1-C subfamily serine protease
MIIRGLLIVLLSWTLLSTELNAQSSASKRQSQPTKRNRRNEPILGIFDDPEATPNTSSGNSISEPVSDTPVADSDSSKKEAAAPAANPVALGSPQFERMVADAKRRDTAQTALEALLQLRVREGLTATQKMRVDKEIAGLKDAAANKLVRMGKNWIDSGEAAQRVKEADESIRKSEALFKVSDFKGARLYLERASKSDQNGIRADFVLGLIHSPLMANDIEATEKYFKRVLQRTPDHIPALNNVALAEIRQKKIGNAIGHLREAARLEPSAVDVVHNIKLILTASRKGLLRLSSKEEIAIGDLYSQLIVDNAEGTPDKSARGTTGGWRWMLPTLPKEEEKRVANEAAMTLREYATGSGFSVAEDYLVTNRHVIDKADRILVDLNESGQEQALEATVVALSSHTDLALLRCEGAKLAPVSFSLEPPRRGTEILILGFPESKLLGKSLKATRGSITALPSNELNGMLLFDATANPGNSGGPVCDKKGNVVAVLTAGIRLEQRLTAGVPTQAVLEFLQGHLPDYKPLTLSREQEWPDVDTEVAQSTFMIRTQRRFYSPNVKYDKGDIEASRAYFEENTCLVCNGTRSLPCNAPGCVRGAVSVRGREAVASERLSGGTITAPVVRKTACGDCNGSGRRNCPFCGVSLD